MTRVATAAGGCHRRTRSPMRRLGSALLAVLLFASACRGDEVLLRSGGTIRGRVISEDEREVVVQTDAGPVKIPRAKVREVLRSQAPPPPTPPATTSAGRFAWPLPTDLVVDERVEKKGKVVRQRHRVRAWRESADDLRVHVHASEIIEIDGVLLTPEQATRPEIAQIAFPFPVWRIGPKGDLREMLDVDRSMSEWIERLLAAAPPDRRAAYEQLKARVATPGFGVSFHERLADMWDAWVGAWSDGSTLAPGQRRDVRRRVSVGPSRSIEVTATLERLEPSSEGRPRLRRVTVLDGEAARAGYEDLLAGMVPEGAARPPVRAYRLETTLEVETDLETLLPARAHVHRRERATIGDGPEREVEERRTWTFGRPER